MRTSICILAIAIVACTLGTHARPEPPKAKVLLIATALDHPFGSHQYSDVCRLLAKCLNQTQGVEAVVCPDLGWPSDPKAFDGVSSIVYYAKAAGDIVLAPEHRTAFEGLMKRGVGFVAIHWGTCAQNADLGPAYIDVLGGWFNAAHSGLKIDTLPLVQADPEHPVCRGWKGYDIHDEFYLNLKFHAQAHPVLKVKVDGVDQTVAWTLERPQPVGDGKPAKEAKPAGRSFGTTLGHFHENFQSEAFRKALVNGILWTAHVEVPKEGAAVALSEEDLKPTPAEGAGK